MKAWKFIVPIALGGLALGGFAIAKSKTNGGKGSAGGGAVAESNLAVEVELRDGSYIGTIYIDGAPSFSVGPRASKSEVMEMIRSRMVADGVRVYYAFTTSPEGAYYFEGWKDGARVLDDQGPYASAAAAMAAGSTWVSEHAGAAVGGVGCPACAGVGQRHHAQGGGVKARGGQRRGPGPGESAVNAAGGIYTRTRGGRKL